MNAPGNDVFDTGDVGLEAVRMQRARSSTPGWAHCGMRCRRAWSRRTPMRCAAAWDWSSGPWTRWWRRRGTSSRTWPPAAASRPASAWPPWTGDTRACWPRCVSLRTEATAIQQRHFGRQTAAAATLQRFEYLIAGLILVMVGAATAYGRRLNRQATRDALERATYVEGLQAAEESLRKAHTHLEKRVEDRTRALRESEAALRRSAEEWQRTFEAIDSPVMILGPDGRVRRLNRAAAERAGRPRPPSRGWRWRSMGPGEPWSSAARVAQRARVPRGGLGAGPRRGQRAHLGAVGEPRRRPTTATSAGSSSSPAT